MKKHTLYIGLACAGWLLGHPASAQTDSTTVDSVQKKARSVQIGWTFGEKEDAPNQWENNRLRKWDRSGRDVKYPRVFGGLMARLEWGLSRPMDNGSFRFSEENQFLEYKKTSNFAIDLAQIGVRFNDAFKVSLATGVEWNYMRLKKNVILDPDSKPLGYTESTVAYDKNVFRTTYLRTPLALEWRTGRNGHGRRAKIAVGAVGGIWLGGKQTLKAGKVKEVHKDDYNLASFQYGAFTRVGFGSLGVYARYYLNDMFENTPKGQELNNFTFGLSWEI